MTFFKKKYIFLFFIFATFSSFTYAQSTNIDGLKLVPRVEVYLLPRTGSFTEGSTFDVPVFINTNKARIKNLEIKINFDKDKLTIIQPSGGISIVGVWDESPSYDNLLGTVSYIGTIPDGIVTESGLVGNVTFKAIGSGQAKITIDSSSKVILDDNIGTFATLSFGRADYSILRKLSEGVHIFSETNPLEGKWYNNNSVTLAWDRDAEVTGFSYILDDKPNTIPDNIIDSNETTKSYESLTSGLWYFHIKAYKRGVWSATGQFIVKIDTIPPGDFKPEINHLLASTIIGRTLVSFFTTDNLSGIDHYEVGTIDESQPISQSPIFIETGTFFQIPIFKGSSLKVIVRAFDKAGNIKYSFIDVKQPFVVWNFIKDNWIYLSLALILFILYYSMKHHVINPFNKKI